jgi:hypothetical protein
VCHRGTCRTARLKSSLKSKGREGVVARQDRGRVPLNRRATTSKWGRKTSECGKIRSGSSLFPSVIPALAPAESRVSPTPFARLVSADPRGSSCEYPRPTRRESRPGALSTFELHGSWGGCRHGFLTIDVFRLRTFKLGWLGSLKEECLHPLCLSRRVVPELAFRSVPFPLGFPSALS